MALNSITQFPMIAGMFDAWSGSRVAGTVEAGGQTTRWPWPLPIGSVLAVFDDPGAAFDILEPLRRAGVTADGVWIVTGTAGAAALREAFAGRGALERLRSVLGSENEILAQLAERCARGGAVVLVRSPVKRTDALAGIVSEHGARLVRRMGRWISEWMVPGE
ncbi:MAG: hypothetical protein AB7R89_22995 [Dehalococcoidia bacterium]